MKKITRPGVSRNNRLSEEGLIRLQKQLANGAAISQPVLDQWIRRYGHDARELIERYAKKI